MVRGYHFSLYVSKVVEYHVKYFLTFDNNFHVYLLDEMIAKVCKNRGKIAAQRAGFAVPILQVAQTAVIVLQFLAYLRNPLIK